MELAGSYGNIGNLLISTGRPAEALEVLRKLLAIRQRLVDANPIVAELQNDLAWAHNTLVRLLVRQKRFAEAFSHIDARLTTLQKLAKAHPEYTSDLGYNHAYRGCALVRSGQPSRAAADLRRALELWAKDNAPASDDRFEQSRVLALLAGLGGEAKSGVTKDEAPALADQAVAALRDAINAGWNEPDELKEPDFDAIRGRDDFKKLVAELEAKAGPKARPKD
jgi:tetratricopeptide (TPR) repeat protein